jgi:cell division protein FtsA
LSAASKIKINYGALNNNSSELIELPVIGDDGSTHEVSLDIVSNVIYARVEETLMILAKMLEDSGFKDQIGAGVVLTGGLTKLGGLRELATAVFDNLPARVAKPKEMEGLFETLRDPSYSTAIGLVLYGGGRFTPYEIDSNKKLRYKNEIIEAQKNIEESFIDEGIEKVSKKDEILSPKDKLAELAVMDNKDRTNGFFTSLWNRLTQLF